MLKNSPPCHVRCSTSSLNPRLRKLTAKIQMGEARIALRNAVAKMRVNPTATIDQVDQAIEYFTESVELFYSLP